MSAILHRSCHYSAGETFKELPAPFSLLHQMGMLLCA